jgi:site-specific recombinase XerD
MNEITKRKKFTPQAWGLAQENDTISNWLEAYFEIEVTTAESSRQVQRRDLHLFLQFVLRVEGADERRVWTKRLSRAFLEDLRRQVKKSGGRYYSDRTIDRIIAHLKTFAKWIHKVAPFPMGYPMEKLKTTTRGAGLETERAITPAERRKLLDAADYLPVLGGRSKDRRHKAKLPDERPRRKGYRSWRNRAIIYALIETGMRRAAVTNLDLGDVDFEKSAVTVPEKGGYQHRYKISREGLRAIEDYLAKERMTDSDFWADSPALFLPSDSKPQSLGRLTPQVINAVWNEVSQLAGIKGKTPHSARHAMGRHVMEKTGNVAAVQRQLGHKNAAYSLQYARITDQELQTVVDERESDHHHGGRR